MILTEDFRIVPEHEKIILRIWWCTSGLIAYKLIAEHGVGPKQYLQDVFELYDKLESRDNLILYNDKYLNDAVNDVVRSFGWEQMINPEQCPDLSPTDYHVFQKFDYSFNMTNCRSLNEVEGYVRKYFEDRKARVYQEGIEIWPERWHRIIEAKGKYIGSFQKFP